MPQNPNQYITEEEKTFLQSLGTGQSSRAESLYGFIPGDWLPDWVKQGYNQSIEGMAQQVWRGEPVFTLDQDYDPNMMEDIGATIISFLTPTDLASLALGGGLGTAAIKKIAVNNLNALKPPIKHKASLIKPERAGNPKPAKNAIIINALYLGI